MPAYISFISISYICQEDQHISQKASRRSALPRHYRYSVECSAPPSAPPQQQQLEGPHTTAVASLQSPSGAASARSSRTRRAPSPSPRLPRRARRCRCRSLSSAASARRRSRPFPTHPPRAAPRWRPPSLPQSSTWRSSRSKTPTASTSSLATATLSRRSRTWPRSWRRPAAAPSGGSRSARRAATPTTPTCRVRKWCLGL